MAAAGEAGVTRLADVTRLDRIGLPVWQAVRPMSRALSVHQGKGGTGDEARLGALLEAVESNAAELFAAAAETNCPFDDLPAAVRAPTISDFAADRANPPSAREPIEWVTGEPLPGCFAVFVPFVLVSLDLTVRLGTKFDRASNGVASAATRDEAALVALHELIERDSMIEWTSLDMADRMASAVDPASIPFAWYRELERRIKTAGARLACYSVPSLTGTPVFACEVNDSTKDGPLYRSANGCGAHPLPEIALFKAVSEACQVRATFIAGARDDLLPRHYSEVERSVRVAFALPSPPGMTGVDFGCVAPGPDTLELLGSTLAAAGYRQGIVIPLAAPPGLAVVRAFVCGLGSITRRRRLPAQ